MAPNQSPDSHGYRIARLEQDVHDLEVQLKDYSALQRDVRNMEATSRQLSEEFTALKRAFYTAALTFCGSLLVGALLWQLAQG